MTACAFDATLTTGVSARPRERSTDFTITPDRSYGARLTLGGDTGCWFPERWTLDGPEPYAVPLPGAQPEEPDSEVLPLSDGQVLIHRRVAGHHAFSLLYPTGPGTGERVLGGIDRADVSLLPPAPGGTCAYALGRGPRSTSLWLIHGGPRGLQHLAEVPGRCTGGAWLDRIGRLLALDRELDGRTKTLVVDLGRGGETSPLLQITERSNDRLLLADPDSGLLLVRSDAAGDERLGWGVLGSTLPVRFPDCLRPPAQATATPFAIQPGQMLTPEACAVAFRIDAAAGGRPWVGVWRPSERRLRQFSAPEGWLAGSGLWSRDGELWLPYATRQVPCGLARVWLPEATAPRASAGSPAGPRVIRRVPRPARETEVSGITPWRKVSGEAVTHAGAGGGTDPRAGWGAGASFSAGASLGAGVRRTLGAGADADPDGGLGTGARFGAGTSLGAGADTSPGRGTDPSADLGAGADPGAGASFGGVRRLGAGTDPRADWGTDARLGTGARTHEDTDPAASLSAQSASASRAPSARFGAGTDPGASASAGADLSVGARFGAGTGPDTTPGASASAGAGTGLGTDTDAGAGPDLRAGWGAGASFGIGARAGADASARMSLGAATGADAITSAGARRAASARFGADTDPGASASAGTDLSTGARFGAGTGPDTAPGASPDTDLGTGLGTGANAGSGARFGVGAGLGTDPRADWGADVSTGVRADAGAGGRGGARPGVGAGARFGDTGAGAGLGTGFGDTGASAGRGESGVEPWVGTGCWPGVEQETGQESELTVVAPRPVPLQQAPLARSREPRPPRWVRDHRPG